MIRNKASKRTNVLLFLTVIIVLSACRADIKMYEPPEPEPQCPYAHIMPKSVWTVKEGITIKLYQDRHPVGTTEMTIIFENNTSYILSHGIDIGVPHLEKYLNGEWILYRSLADKPTVGLALWPYEMKVFTAYITNKPDYYGEGLYRLTHEWNFITFINNPSNYATKHPLFYLEFIISAIASPEPEVIKYEGKPLWFIY